jgi:tetratricopeptide (TPR) repeat protein
MIRLLNVGLLIVILAESLVGALLIARRSAAPQSPAARLEVIDALTAADLQRIADRCSSADDWVVQGDAMLAYGFLPESEACYRQAAELSPADAEITYQWAFSLSRFGKSQESTDQFRKALELGYPEPASCFYFIGRNYLREENAVEARNAFTQAGDLAAARYELARLDLREGRVESAASILDELLNEHSGCLQLCQTRARAATLLGQSSDVAKHLEAAEHSVYLLPTPFNEQHDRVSATRPRYGLIKRQEACREMVDADDLLRSAAVFSECLDVAWWSEGAMQLAQIESRLNQPHLAERWVGEAIQRDGPSPHTLMLLAHLRLMSGQRETCIELLHRAEWMGSASQLEGVHENLASIYQEDGDERASLRHAALASHSRGVSLLRLNDLPPAKHAFEEATARLPEHAASWFYLGETLRRLKDVAAAKEAYQRCLEIDPEHGPALRRLSQLSES